MKGSAFTFEVSKSASKSEIERIVEKKFKVDVLSVKTVTLHGKKKSMKSRRGSYTTPGLKKAIVTLKRGQKIAIFEAPVEKEEVTVTTAEGPLRQRSEASEVLTTTKERKSLLKGTKVKIEKNEMAAKATEQRESRQTDKGGKKKGEG